MIHVARLAAERGARQLSDGHGRAPFEPHGSHGIERAPALAIEPQHNRNGLARLLVVKETDGLSCASHADDRGDRGRRQPGGGSLLVVDLELPLRLFFLDVPVHVDDARRLVEYAPHLARQRSSRRS